MFSNFNRMGMAQAMVGQKPGGMFGQAKPPVYGGSVGDTVGPAQQDQSKDLYTQMRGGPAPGVAPMMGGGLAAAARSMVGQAPGQQGAAPSYDQFMGAAIRQRRMSRGQNLSGPAPGMAPPPPKGSVGAPDGYSK